MLVPVELLTSVSMSVVSNAVSDALAGRRERRKGSLGGELNPEVIQHLQEALATANRPPTDLGESTTDAEITVGGAALVTNSDRVFESFRKRVAISYGISLCMTVLIAALIVAAIAGTVVAAVSQNAGIGLLSAGAALGRC